MGNMRLRYHTIMSEICHTICLWFSDRMAYHAHKCLDLLYREPKAYGFGDGYYLPEDYFDGWYLMYSYSEGDFEDDYDD